jgi:hypothetical protein
MKRVLVERKDISKWSTSAPSVAPLFAAVNFCRRLVSDETISDIGGRKNFSDCSIFRGKKKENLNE